MHWNEDVTRRDYLSVEERHNLQLTRLRETVQRVATRVPFYRQLLAERNISAEDIQSLDDLRHLPFTTREHLIENYPFGLLSVPGENLVRIHASSGTKGRSKIVGYTRKDIEIWSEVCARSLVCAGLKAGDILHNAYGYGLFTGGLGLHYGGEYLGATVVPISSGNVQRQITFLHDLQATAIACTPSYALTIAEALTKMELGPEALALKCGIFGAEPWTEEMRTQVERALGITALDIYGLSEIIGPGVAMECLEGHNATGKEVRSLHIFEDHFLPEIIDPQTGEPLPPGQEGELVFTTITKEGMPLLRYRTGDLCSLISHPCACGRTLVKMSQIKGRVDDMLIIRGVNVYPSEIERVLLGISELAPHYQVVIERQKTLDEAVVKVEITSQFYQSLEEMPGQHHDWQEHDAVEALQQHVCRVLFEMLNLHINTHISAPGTLPRSEGKAVRILDRRNLH